MKDHLGNPISTWSDICLQVAAFYWRRAWWELTNEEIATAWLAYCNHHRTEGDD